ncbi:MAG: ArsR/SmtB family transcription factor [Paracoccaceae bacterium]
MEQSRALKSFSALAHETRLDILHLLVGAGADGLSAGVIGAQVDVLASRLSFHLNVLEQAGLVSSQRKSRNVIYNADYGALKHLVRYLLQDCCRDHPAICGNLRAISDRDGASPPTEE